MKKATAFLSSACVIFTLFTLLFHLADVALGGATSKLISQFSLVAACLFLAAANRILRISKLPLAARMILHYIAVCVILLGIFSLVGNLISTPVQFLLMYTCITIFYIGFAVAYLIVNRKKKAKQNDAAEYKSIF